MCKLFTECREAAQSEQNAESKEHNRVETDPNSAHVSILLRCAWLEMIGSEDGGINGKDKKVVRII